MPGEYFSRAAEPPFRKDSSLPWPQGLQESNFIERNVVSPQAYCIKIIILYRRFATDRLLMHA